MVFFYPYIFFNFITLILGDYTTEGYEFKKTDSYYDANFIVSGGGSHYDKLC